MTYQSLFERAGNRRVQAGLVGTGTFGISLLAQALMIPRLDIPVVCDLDIDVARRACLQAGIPQEQTIVCNTHRDVVRAVERRRCAIVDDFTLLMDAPIDVVVECTGIPEAGARHCEQAIQHGKHVAMVNKETDVVVGPMLRRLADRAGVIYTPVDGDQHGLLMGLVSWSRTLGLEVICGGKARTNDFVYDERARIVSGGPDAISLTQAEMLALDKIAPGDTAVGVAARREILRELSQVSEADLCELAITANATGLMPDVPASHAPIVRTVEIPTALCPQADGGILEQSGVVEVVTCLRRADEPGFGGGVFVVLGRQNEYLWDLIKTKGLLVNESDTAGVLFRPYHLLCVETPISILCAGLLNVSTGSMPYQPRVDLIVQTKQPLPAGTTVGGGHTGQISSFYKPLVLPATVMGKDHPIPYYLADGNRLKVDVPVGTILTYEMVEPPAESRLWALRREQDRVFLAAEQG